MRGVLTVAGLSLLKTRKDKVFLVLMIGMALLFTSIIGLVFSKSETEPKIPVGVADLDESSLSVGMLDSLKSAGIYSVTAYPEASLRDAVREGKVEVGFVIPNGFEERLSGIEALKVKVVSVATSNTAMVIGKVLERKVTEHLLVGAVQDVALEQAIALSLPGAIDVTSLARKVSEDYSQRPALVADFANVTHDGQKTGDGLGLSYVIGIFLMFTMFTVVFTAGDILQERRDGTWIRLMASPAPRASILGGKILGTYVVGAMQLTILLLAGRYLFKVDYGPNPLGIAVVMAVFLLAVTGLGIMLSTVVRTLAQLQTLAPIVIVATCMLGGCYWPLEVVSPLMQVIGKFTPQAWAMMAATDLAARGGSLAATSRNLLMLLGFAGLFFGIGVTRVKYE